MDIKFFVTKVFMFSVIKNHKFLMLHGDDVRGGTMTVKSLEAVQNRMMGLLKDIPNYTLAGHFHNCSEITTNSGRIIINGAFIGGDMYSLKTLQRGNVPEQKIFGIHEKRGITWSYNVNLSIDREGNHWKVK